MRILITGGAGFIGSAAVRRCVRDGHEAMTVDKLTYAGDTDRLAEVWDSPRHKFLEADIADGARIRKAFAAYRPELVLHFAAETHVDRSIDGPAAFIHTNIVGVFTLLETALDYWRALSDGARDQFRFVHVSTDEVYGALGADGQFTETTAYDPRSPYAASKASADHLVSAWSHTYGLPVIITNCTNNYGPHQHGEKLLPTIVRNAVMGREIPIYGDGGNVRDWLHVDDHVEGVLRAASHGDLGERYNFGGDCERSNLALAHDVCRMLDDLSPRSDGKPYANQITMVADRPGHDWRYAVDATKAKSKLGWAPAVSLDDGLRTTAQWYLDRLWADADALGDGERLGLGRFG